MGEGELSGEMTIVTTLESGTAGTKPHAGRENPPSILRMAAGAGKFFVSDGESSSEGWYFLELLGLPLSQGWNIIRRTLGLWIQEFPSERLFRYNHHAERYEGFIGNNATGND